MSTSDRVMTQHRTHPGATLRVAVSGHLAAGRGSVARPDGVDRH